MTDAEKRDKVIRGLEYCLNRSKGKVHCGDCPYWQDDFESGCHIYDMMRDALALLKEQEPRVLSWEEVKKSGSAYRCVEIYSPQVQRLALIYCIVRQSETIPEFYYLLEDSGVRWCRAEAEYNRDCWQGTVSGWRCWTAWPSEKMRNEVPWDE